MVTIREYLDQIEEGTATERLQYLFDHPEELTVGRMWRIRDGESAEVRQPGKAYRDGSEFFVGWGNARQHLKVGEPDIAVFHLYLSSQGTLFNYYVGGISPTREDINKG